MRFAVGVLLCLNVSAIPLALADPPAASPTAPQAADAPAAAPAAPSAPAASSPAATAAPAAVTRPAATGPSGEDEVSEKHFLAEGYRLEMHNGQKWFCRREEVLGSRLGGQKTCSTLDHLKHIEAETHDTITRAQRNMPTPRNN